MPWQVQWSRLAYPGGGVYSSPIAVSWGPGRIDLFARGQNNTLHYTSYERSWGNSQFLSLRGNLDSDFIPSAVSWYPGRLDVFALGRDGSGNIILQHTWRQDNGPWNNWEPLGGSNLDPASVPTSVSWDFGRLDVFVLGADGKIDHIWYFGGWSNWESLGENEPLGTGFTSPPHAVSWGNGRLDVFALGTDNMGNTNVRHKQHENEQWTNWRILGENEPLGTGFTSPPHAVSWGNGRLDVFARGGDNSALRHIWFDGMWRAWEELGANEDLGTFLTSPPHAVSWGNGRMDVFAKDSENHIIHKWHGDGRWGNWERLGQDVFVRGPNVVSWGNGRLDVFALGADRTLYTKSYYSPSRFVRLHFKVLAEPMSVTVAQMVNTMRQIFASGNIRFDVITEERLNLPTLMDIDIGSCTRFNTTNEQNELFSNNRHNVRINDIVIYVVRMISDSPGTIGCAAHPEGIPSCVVVRDSNVFTLAHEIGHVLGLEHVNDTDRLMFPSASFTNPPPDIVPSEIATMNNSRLVHSA